MLNFLKFEHRVSSIQNHTKKPKTTKTLKTIIQSKMRRCNYVVTNTIYNINNMIYIYIYIYQKWTPVLFQNDVALYFEALNKKMWLTWIFFWCFIKLNDWAFQWKKNKILQLTKSKVMALPSKQEIVANHGMWLTHSSHLE